MDTAVFLFHALDHALNQAVVSEPEVQESEPSPEATRAGLVKVCCANFPSCTRKKDRRRKDGLCFLCAQSQGA
jgi:hypothetical protein